MATHRYRTLIATLAGAGVAFVILATFFLTWNFPRPYGMGWGSNFRTIAYWTLHFIIVLSPLWATIFVGWFCYQRGKGDRLLEDATGGRPLATQGHIQGWLGLLLITLLAAGAILYGILLLRAPPVTQCDLIGPIACNTGNVHVIWPDRSAIEQASLHGPLHRR